MLEMLHRKQEKECAEPLGSLGEVSCCKDTQLLASM